ncbi:hypothetical protein H4R34_000801 [Dimargaris verticillata]|uniref:holo-[acyl-carrier-protein] synthase n=1 Tax=Dimargaris verticillata TaxID=2761393 RepID=A0A9W8EEC6_9FUNG|nr:hypothetical protein H4R34_000801 [Dimargaris verticillata]
MAATDKPSPALVRWAFNIRQPAITPQLTATLLAYVQPEERARIQQFKFADQHRVLFGRLLMRCLLFQVANGLNKRLRPSGLPHADSTVPQVNWWTIQLTRTTENKPVLSIKTQQLPAFQLCLTNDPGTSTEPASIPLAFNVSHHGDWVVLVAGYARHLGVDVSEVDFPRAESLDDYFALMQAQFTPHEWHLIRPTDPRGLAKTTCLYSPTHPSPSCSRCYAQLTQFHRLWCLKESYVKAKGVGLNLNLQRIEFHHIAPAVPHSANPSLSAQVCSTASIELPIWPTTHRYSAGSEPDWYPNIGFTSVGLPLYCYVALVV